MLLLPAFARPAAPLARLRVHRRQAGMGPRQALACRASLQLRLKSCCCCFYTLSYSGKRYQALGAREETSEDGSRTPSETTLKEDERTRDDEAGGVGAKRHHKTVPGKPWSNYRFTQVGEYQRNKPCRENQSQTSGNRDGLRAPRLDKSSWRTV